MVDSTWPYFIAPPEYNNPADGWQDPQLPDFVLLWEVAKSHGYAIGLHGSMKRDVDLIAVPWVEHFSPPDVLVNALCKTLNAKQIGNVEIKPHGRIAVWLQIDGFYKGIDLSIIEDKESDYAALEANYNELIMAVETKIPNETRHETALRYIQNAERSCNGPEQVLNSEDD